MEYYESYKQPWPKSKSRKRTRVTSWKLVWIVSEIEKEEIITGNYALCQHRKDQVKPNYRSGELKIIPNQ